ncbi:cytochrome c [Roseivirga sp.]|uniref:c-type cytochrome n=1 Tax=Roseivirga sp. TaxID=1964215 RepID=UPI002B269623|nr:cytochrome c [Roseivirga sp.]
MKKTHILFAVLAVATISFSFTTVQDAALKKSMTEGKDVYEGLCMACHMNEGQGIASVFPPLAKSDFLMKDLDRSINVLIKGQQGEITVNGKKYKGAMPATGLDDKDIADVLNYVRNSWGNKGDRVTTEQVAKVRAKK